MFMPCPHEGFIYGRAIPRSHASGHRPRRLRVLNLTGLAIIILIIELTPGQKMARLAEPTMTEGHRFGIAALWKIASAMLCNRLERRSGLRQCFKMFRSCGTGEALGPAIIALLAVKCWRTAHRVKRRCRRRQARRIRSPVPRRCRFWSAPRSAVYSNLRYCSPMPEHMAGCWRYNRQNLPSACGPEP